MNPENREAMMLSHLLESAMSQKAKPKTEPEDTGAAPQEEAAKGDDEGNSPPEHSDAAKEKALARMVQAMMIASRSILPEKHPLRAKINAVIDTAGAHKGSAKLAGRIVTALRSATLESAPGLLDEAEGAPVVLDEVALPSTLRGSESPSQVGKTIIDQMGGARRLQRFVGARIYYTGDGAFFVFPNRQRSKGNAMKITYDRGKDLYDVEFLNVTSAAAKVVKKHTGVQAEDLVPMFERQTGWYLRL